MNIADLRKKSETELKSELSELFQEQFNLRLQRATGQLQKTHLMRVVRRNIARIKTLLTEQKGDANDGK